MGLVTHWPVLIQISAVALVGAIATYFLNVFAGRHDAVRQLGTTQAARRARRRHWLLVALWIVVTTAVGVTSSALSSGSDGSTAGVVGFTGGCARFQIFAQNRWAPYGTAVRTEPDVNSKKIAGFPGNYSISVNGWVHSSVAYKTNTAPWNSDIWFHLADGSGWVSFAGVRGVPTPQDPTGLSPDGGAPAPATAQCQGSEQ